MSGDMFEGPKGEQEGDLPIFFPFGGTQIRGGCHPSPPHLLGRPMGTPQFRGGGDKWGVPAWGPTHPRTSSGDLLGRVEDFGWGLG